MTHRDQSFLLDVPRKVSKLAEILNSCMCSAGDINKRPGERASGKKITRLGLQAKNMFPVNSKNVLLQGIRQLFIDLGTEPRVKMVKLSFVQCSFYSIGNL